MYVWMDRWMLIYTLFSCFKNTGKWARWRKSKTRRSPSSPQIHQKYIYTWKCSYRTPTERWQKTSDLPKGKKLPTYLGRAKEKRNNRDKRIGMGPAPGGGSREGGGELRSHGGERSHRGAEGKAERFPNGGSAPSSAHQPERLVCSPAGAGGAGS